MSADHQIALAATALARGELVAFPTETVYGLGANAADPVAIARLYAAKGRPADHPVIVHVAGVEELPRWVRSLPPSAGPLVSAFWPGPLTLVLPRASGVLDAVTGGQDTVAVRCPAHPLARALLKAAADHGVHGVVAPSANRYGRVSPTTAAHVRAEFGDEVAIVLDGGPCTVGIESTIVDLTGPEPRLLRPGMLTARALAAVLGAPLAGADGADVPRVSGSLPAHYAPRTPLELVAPGELAARVTAALNQWPRIAVLARPASLARLAGGPRLVLHPAAKDAGDYARALYAELRSLDETGAGRLLVECPPDTPEWHGINDRLTRAARGSGAEAPGTPG